MIIHCTQKLAAKLPEVSAVPLQETSPLGSWHAHVYVIDRKQCVLFCHDDTRYTLFLPGLRKPNFAELGHLFRELFTATLAVIGVPDSQIRRAELALGPVRFDTAYDRSVQGSLKQMHFGLQCFIEDVPDVMLVDPLAMSLRLSHYPVRIRNGKEYWMADKAMRERVMGLGYGNLCQRLP